MLVISNFSEHCMLIRINMETRTVKWGLSWLKLCSFVNSRNISIKLGDKVYIWSLNNRVKFRTKIPLHWCNINKVVGGDFFFGSPGIWHTLKKKSNCSYNISVQRRNDKSRVIIVTTDKWTYGHSSRSNDRTRERCVPRFRWTPEHSIQMRIPRLRLAQSGSVHTLTHLMQP